MEVTISQKDFNLFIGGAVLAVGICGFFIPSVKLTLFLVCILVSGYIMMNKILFAEEEHEIEDKIVKDDATTIV
jgi:hypothetical protein